ncbi:MAG TPA: hypothetical protein VGR28_11600 [Candidatus Thermoplasmatota archaeon]|nr:hypothetical protein [Candidatus Thermoplasmatota archaeon]
MPRTLLLAEASQAEVNKQVRGELEQRGALFDERTHARTVFEGLRTQAGLKRGGYVGAYQPMGEKGVEVLLEAWASGPRRLWWATVAIQLVVVVVLLAASPGSAVFFLAAIVLWPWLIVAGLVYALSFQGSRATEVELAAAFAARFQRAGWALVSDEAQLEQRIRAKLEGEAKARALAAQPPSPAQVKPPKPQRGRRGKAQPADAEAAPAAGKRGLFGRKRERA